MVNIQKIMLPYRSRYCQFTFDKRPEAIQWRKHKCFQQTVTRKVDIHVGKKESKHILHLSQKLTQNGS